MKDPKTRKIRIHKGVGIGFDGFPAAALVRLMRALPEPPAWPDLDAKARFNDLKTDDRHRVEIERMEPIEAPPHAIWRGDFEEFGPDRWAEMDPAWAAPELDLGDGRRLVLDGPDPFPEEEWAVSGVN